MKMKKVLTALSVFSILTVTAVPAFAVGNNGNININVTGNHDIIVLNDINGNWAEKYMQ